MGPHKQALRKKELGFPFLELFKRTERKKLIFSPFLHGTCTVSFIEEYLGLEGSPSFLR